MKKVMLEALAAWLALAAVYGQACAAMQTGANSVSTIASRDAGVSIADDTAIAVSLLKVSANAKPSANADVALLTPAATERSGTRTRLAGGARAPATGPFRLADARQSNAASGFSLPVADDFTFRRKNAHSADLKRLTFDRRNVAALQEVFVPANVGSVRIEAMRTVLNDDSEAATVSLLPGPKLVPETMVAIPEPGRWATALAGLLGVIAIARRRMSL